VVPRVRFTRRDARAVRPPVRVFLLALTVGLVAEAQSPQQRRWAGAADYDLANGSFTEADPVRQIALLSEWATQYPTTEFERERLITFAIAFQRVGKLRDAFTCATELLSLDPDDSGALLLVAALGPTLPLASENQIATVTASAMKLLSGKVPPSPVVATTSSIEPTDNSKCSLTLKQRVLAFVRQLRKGPVVPTDPSVTERQVAEAALEWAKKGK
jgi:hypothetical protein